MKVFSKNNQITLFCVVDPYTFVYISGQSSKYKTVWIHDNQYLEM